MFFYLSLSQSYHTPEAARAVDREGVDPLFRFSLFRFFDAGGSAAGGAAGGAGGAAGRQTPPLQWLSVFFGKAAPQPGHVARRLCTFKEQAGHVFIDGARLGLGLGAALARGEASSSSSSSSSTLPISLTRTWTSSVRRADSWAQKPPASVDVGFAAGGW